MATSARVTQDTARVVSDGTPDARVSQTTVRVVSAAVNHARITQNTARVVSAAGNHARITQTTTRVVSNEPLITASVTQATVRVVSDNVATAQVTQSTARVVSDGIPWARITQATARVVSSILSVVSTGIRTVPALVPCPQTSTVTPEEGRLLSDSDRAPRAARLLERDERQFQTLTWALTAEQSAAFRDWWRTDLIEGGAWWSAPDTWPTPEGFKVKVRRFVGAPSWGYMGVGVWQVACDCEVRGETLLPSEPEEEVLPYFLDTFTGTGALTAHTPDIAPAGFTYTNSGAGPDTTLALDGTGHVTTVPVGYGTSGPALANYTPPMEFAYPYVITFIGRPTDVMVTSMTNLYLESPDSSYINFTIDKYTEGGTPPWYITVEVQSDAGGYRWFYQEFASATEHALVLTVSAADATLTVDGVVAVAVDTFEGPMTNIFSSFNILVDGDDPVPHAYIDEIRIMPG